jgi:hypothetical protein
MKGNPTARGFSFGRFSRRLVLGAHRNRRFRHSDTGALAGPTFMRHYVLTREDVEWLRSLGVDAEVTNIEDCIKRRKPD